MLHQPPGKAITNSKTAEAQTPFTLGSEHRIKKRSEYLLAQSEGKKLFSKHFLYFIRKNPGKNSRLGITVSKKVDKRAAVRNRIKRCLRETFRAAVLPFVREIDIVVIAKSNSGEVSFNEVKKEVQKTLSKAGYITETNGE